MDIVLYDNSQRYFSLIVLCHGSQCGTARTTSSLPHAGAHMLVQCIMIDIYLPPVFNEGAKLTTCHM